MGKWWFQTFGLCSISYMGCHPKPIDEVHHFSRWPFHQAISTSCGACSPGGGEWLGGENIARRKTIYIYIYVWVDTPIYIYVWVDNQYQASISIHQKWV
jgi:hypothetical protein